jgi:hypothetical protein
MAFTKHIVMCKWMLDTKHLNRDEAKVDVPSKDAKYDPSQGTGNFCALDDFLFLTARISINKQPCVY